MAELKAVHKPGGVWRKTRDPRAPAPPTYQDPNRCLHCGHLSTQHVPEVGCTVEGGKKYIEDPTGKGWYACGCEQFIPAPPAKEM